MLIRESCKANIKKVTNQIRNNRGARTSLWKHIIKTGNLRDKCGNFGLKRKMLVCNEEPTNPPKINRAKKVL